MDNGRHYWKNGRFCKLYTDPEKADMNDKRVPENALDITDQIWNAYLNAKAKPEENSTTVRYEAQNKIVEQIFYTEDRRKLKAVTHWLTSKNPEVMSLIYIVNA